MKTTMVKILTNVYWIGYLSAVTHKSLTEHVVLVHKLIHS